MALGALIVVSVATLATASALVTRPRGFVELVLTAALVAFAWLVLAALGLSLFDAFDAGWLAACSGAAAVSAVVLARRRGASPPTPRSYLILRARHVVAEPRLAALSLVVVLSLAYALALALFTPAAEIDAIAYHLTRAAFWVQSGAVGAVPGSQDARIDESPPGAEILVAVTMLVSGGVRLAGLVQWLTALVLIGAVAGIARRLGAEPRPAWFAGLLVAPLPTIALQVPTGMNDVVAVSLVALSVFFLLGDRRIDPALAGIAVALMLLTKMTTLVALPVILAVGLLARPVGLRWQRVAAVVVGAAAGSLWLLVQHSAPGAGAIGGVSTSYGASLDVVAAFGRWTRLMTELLELPGAVGADALLYVVAAGVLATVGLSLRSRRRTLLCAATLVALTPLLVWGAEVAARTHRKVWFELGQTHIAFTDLNRSVTGVSSTGAWPGAIGLAVAVLGIVVASRGSTWRSTPVLGLLALAPLLWIVGFAMAIGYSPDEGRYIVPGVALGAAATAPLLYRPALAWWAIAVTATTLLLVWTHSAERPAGIRLLSGSAPTSVWTRDDADALGPVRGMPEAIRFVSGRVPAGARLALYPAPFPDPPTRDPVALLPWPFFGSALDRHVVYALSLAEAGGRGADWALLPRFLTEGCRPGWRRETDPSAAYQLFRRDLAAGCRAPSG